MKREPATLNVAQALKVIRLKLDELSILEKKVGVHDLTAEAQAAAKEKRPTLFEAIQNIKHDLTVLRGKVELQDPERFKKLVEEGVIPSGTQVPYLNLEAEVFTKDVTELIPNRHQFERGVDFLEKDRLVPFKYYEAQALNAPLFNQLKKPNLTQGQLVEAFNEHTRKELGLPKR